MKDLLYELASFSLGVAEYLMFDWIEGERGGDASVFPSCQLSDRPAPENGLGLLYPVGSGALKEIGLSAPELYSCDLRDLHGDLLRLLA